MTRPSKSDERWRPTACILCSRNCGLEVVVADGHLTRIRGDRRHPLSRGYLCQKASRLDHYQNNADRLSAPLRRLPDGSFEEVSWETAIAEVAGRIRAIRDAHGGRALAYYGGGGQGNHLGGVYGRGLVAAMRTRSHYSALAQEKTGDFWVNGRLFGRQTCHVTEGVEDAELVVLIGTNPWQAHGIRNARETLKKVSQDPARRLVVIDPRRSESATMADLHVQLRPGTDAFLLAAILAVLVREGRENKRFLGPREDRGTGRDGRGPPAGGCRPPARLRHGVPRRLGHAPDRWTVAELAHRRRPPRPAHRHALPQVRPGPRPAPRGCRPGERLTPILRQR